MLKYLIIFKYFISRLSQKVALVKSPGNFGSVLAALSKRRGFCTDAWWVGLYEMEQLLATGF